MKDAAKKGRIDSSGLKKALENHFHKLSEKQVKRIREDGEKVTKLADEFNVCVSLIFKIRQGIRWKKLL